jgi:hypothetical protein
MYNKPCQRMYNLLYVLKDDVSPMPIPDSLSMRLDHLVFMRTHHLVFMRTHHLVSMRIDHSVSMRIDHSVSMRILFIRNKILTHLGHIL